jgi:ABC-type uncharacterized transport system substrate-binding protein
MEGNLATPATDAIDREVRAGLETSPYVIQHYIEYTGTALLSDEASYRKLSERYRDNKPDVIIAAGSTPIKFMVESHEQLFGDTPIVFCGSSEEQAGHPKLDSHFTGVWLTIDPTKTLEAALQLQPSTQHVVVVSGVSSYDKRVEAIVREDLRSYESKLEFRYLTDLEMPVLLERLRHLPKNTIVLYASLMKDTAGTFFVPATGSVPMVVSAANAPVFTMSDTTVGQGTVGGYVHSFAADGKVAAAVTMRILRGERPQDIPIVRGANVYMFDWRALQRWGFRESALPPGSVVLYQRPTAWQSYKRYIIGAIFVVTVETLLILGLLWQRARRRKVEESLVERLTFESLLSDLSTTFINLPEEQIDSNIGKGLGRIAEFLNVEGITLYEFSPNRTDLTASFSWTREGISPAPTVVTINEVPWWANHFLRGEAVLASDSNELPEEASVERARFRKRGLESAASIPLKIGGELIGAMSLVSTKRRVLCDLTDLLYQVEC